MATKIILKKSSVAATPPTALDLDVGEIAVNLADQKLYSKNGFGEVIEIGRSTFDFINFDTEYVETGLEPIGSVYYNPAEDTLNLKQNGTNLQFGQELHWPVRNTSGATILDGTPVMATGTVGNSGRMTIAPMVSTVQANAKYYIGILTQTLANGEDGKVTSYGKVRGLDTSIYQDGDVLFLDPYNNGQLTATEPTVGMNIATAFVVHSHTNGTLAVRVTNLDENHFLTPEKLQDGAQEGEVLYWNGLGFGWKDGNFLLKSGGTVTGNISLTDNSKAVFGTGNDLSVYHDGLNSYIDETGTGGLFIKSSALHLQSSTGESFLTAATNGGVSIYYDNNLTISTTSDGVTLAGNLTISGTVDGRAVALDGYKLDTIAYGADATTSGNVDPLIDLHLNTDTAVAGQVLSWDGLDYDWVTGGAGGGASTLDELADVVITTPSTGQVLKYNGSQWVNDTDATGSGGGGAATLVVSDTAPSSPTQGTLWFNSTDATLMMWYEDGTSNQWIEIVGSQGPTGPDANISKALAMTFVFN